MTRRAASLATMLAGAGLTGARVIGDASVRIVGVTNDSRAVEAGSLYCCLPGRHHDGHEFAAAAVDAGASALLVEHELALAVPQVVVADARAAMAPLAASWAGHPSRRLSVVGVTGTNGKTTTVNLLSGILRHAGRTTEVIGTLTGSYTTPEAPELQARLADFVDRGVTDLAMEVSSHALVQHRVDAIHFRAAVFTNLGHDHLDLHGTQEEYFAAKRRLFEPGRADVAVIDADDAWGRRLLSEIDIPAVPFGVADVAEIQVGVSHHSYVWHGRHVVVPLGGRFNVANSLAAATTAAALGIDDEVIAAGLGAAATVPGRFESIATGRGFSVVVDYAHTPDGLHAVIDAAREVTERGRVIVVFGCGGERDREKRPAMGAIVAREADLTVVTSDNPRCEDPGEIIREILGGVPAELRRALVVEPDRRTAIRAALLLARDGDVVVIAGKGHESTQTVGTNVLPFDDRAVAREELEATA